MVVHDTVNVPIKIIITIALLTAIKPSTSIKYLSLSSLIIGSKRSLFLKIQLATTNDIDIKRSKKLINKVNEVGYTFMHAILVILFYNLTKK